jgi:hypothetical protein
MNFNPDTDCGAMLRSASENGITMIQCKELSNKVVRLVTIYEDGTYGPEVHIEFTDGTTFSACLKTNISIEAKYIHDQGGEPSILRDYSAPAIPR